MPRVLPVDRQALLDLIDTEVIIKRMMAFVTGEKIRGKTIELSSDQLRAATLLLARSLPEVKQVLQDTNHNFNGDHSELATAAIISEIQRRRAGTDADGARGRPN